MHHKKKKLKEKEFESKHILDRVVLHQHKYLSYKGKNMGKISKEQNMNEFQVRRWVWAKHKASLRS